MSGKRQRPAHFEVDEKTLEQVEDTQKKQQSQKESAEQISQRKIFKIKGISPGADNGEQSKPKFIFTANSAEQPSQKAEDKQAKTQGKSQAKQQKQSKQGTASSGLFTAGSLFGGNKSGNSSDNGVGLFSKGPAGSTGLFSNNSGPTLFTLPGDKKGSIFSNEAINTGAESKGIFGTGASIFGNNNIFSKTQGSQQNKPNGSLFGTTQSIFGFSTNGMTTTPSAGRQDDEDGDGDSAELEKDQNLAIDPSKSTGNYEYKSDLEVIFSGKLVKVKKNNGEIVENVEVIVNHDAAKDLRWVIIRLSATKNPIITGLLLKGKCDIKKIGSKDENVTLSVVVMKQKVPERHVLKLQFQSPEDGKKFIHTLEPLIK